MRSYTGRNIAGRRKEAWRQLGRGSYVAGDLVGSGKRCVLCVGNGHKSHVGQFVW